MKIYDIISDGCSLNVYGKEHDEKTVVWLNDPFIKKSFGISYSVSEMDHRNWVENQKDLMMWAIYAFDNYVGNVSLRISERHKKAYFEIYIGDEDVRGIGLGKKVLNLILNFCFNEMNFNRVYLYTRVDNIAANKLYEKSGFIKEGVERETVLQSDGIYYDQILWAMLKSDFLKRQSYEE